MVWTGVAGKADLQTGAPERPDMLFGIGSITKTFVMVVVLQMLARCIRAGWPGLHSRNEEGIHRGGDESRSAEIAVLSVVFFNQLIRLF